MQKITLIPVGLFLLAGCATVPVTVDPSSLRLSDAGRVAVSWNDPDGYHEFSCRMLDAGRHDWVKPLAEHTRKEAEHRLPQGARIDVHFNDIDRAGECQPGRTGNQYRIVRDIYPPRIELDYRLRLADGTVREAQNVMLTDLGYLTRIPGPASSESLVHEKRLVDDWLRGVLGDQ